MKSAKAPTPPDPVATAAAQTASNKETAGYSQSMNLIDQNTPLGSLKYTNVGTDPTTGAPKYQLDQTLSESGQKSFDLQQAVSEALNNLALKGTGQVSSAFDKAQDYSNIPGMKPFNAADAGPIPTANAEDYQKAQDALYNQFTSRLDPQYEKEQRVLENQLIQKGFRQGTPGWNDAVSEFRRGKTDAYQTAKNNSVTGATANQQAQFGMKQQAYQDAIYNLLKESDVSQSQRGQGITEANYLRELPINEISSLLTGGQVQMPSFSSTPQTQLQGTNVAGIIQDNFNNEMGIYKQKQASNDALTGAVFSLAGSALGGWATGGFK